MFRLSHLILILLKKPVMLLRSKARTLVSDRGVLVVLMSDLLECWLQISIGNLIKTWVVIYLSVADAWYLSHWQSIVLLLTFYMEVHGAAGLNVGVDRQIRESNIKATWSVKYARGQTIWILLTTLLKTFIILFCCSFKLWFLVAR